MKIPFVDNFLNKITTYRLVLYYLLVLVIVAVVESYFGIISSAPRDILIQTVIALITCYSINLVFSKVFRCPTNVESVFITALILVLIIPVEFPANALFFVFASILAMAIKYVFVIHKRHVFNPAAGAVMLLGLLSSNYSPSWWVGNYGLAPFVFIGGLLLVRKIRRETMVTTFLFVELLIAACAAFIQNGSFATVLNTLRQNVLYTPLFFFTFVMLTEPLTTPTRKNAQKKYAALVAILYANPQLLFLRFAFTLELALCIGNIYTYLVDPWRRYRVLLKEKIKITSDSYLFSFGKIPNFSFIPGQYMEWTIPQKDTDARGNRRYFSMASAPLEDLKILVKFYNPSSSYKTKLLSLETGDSIIVSQLAGDFVLPKNPEKKLVYIAGGVGIAPFRSIIQDLIDTNTKRDIVLLFSNRYQEDIMFSDIFEKAQNNGVQIYYILTDKEQIPSGWNGGVGHITKEMIAQSIPDYKERTFYISGPQPMVQSAEGVLFQMGIFPADIKTDYFPGYETI